MDDFDYDYCYECTGFGDDYYYNEGGELVCRCDDCPCGAEMGIKEE